MRLIDADALDLDREVELADDWNTAHEIANCVKYAPTIDAVPVVHGRWINIANGNCDDLCKCSECKETWLGIGGYNYCPHCGAKMDGERKEV